MEQSSVRVTHHATYAIRDSDLGNFFTHSEATEWRSALTQITKQATTLAVCRKSGIDLTMLGHLTASKCLLLESGGLIDNKH